MSLETGGGGGGDGGEASIGPPKANYGKLKFCHIGLIINKLFTIVLPKHFFDFADLQNRHNFYIGVEFSYATLAT